jgi:N-acetylglucosaminyldiphosphoundecaprenol N-acetyl-beta-D-mannosaminyltransferase
MIGLSYRIGNAYISATNPNDAEERINEILKRKESGFICVSNTYTVGLANKREDYNNVMSNALMCLPDGMPLVWMAKLWGFKDVERTSGPELFIKMVSNPNNGYRHYLLGDTDETLTLIQEKYPHANIVGYYSPSFVPLEEYDFEQLALKINKSGADIVWVSLKAPKQDFFSFKIFPMIQNKLCIGVGAAFRFATGEYRFPSKTAQKLGLTGVFLRKNKVALIIWNINQLLTISKWALVIIYERIRNEILCKKNK